MKPTAAAIEAHVIERCASLCARAGVYFAETSKDHTEPARSQFVRLAKLCDALAHEIRSLPREFD